MVTWTSTEPTGGNAYTAELVGALRRQGADVEVHRVPGRWPAGAPADHERLAHLLAGEGPWLVDGIVASCAPASVADAVGGGREVSILMHLPIAAEVGLDPKLRQRYADLEAAAVRAASGVICTSHWAVADLARRYGPLDSAVALPGVHPAPIAPGSPPGEPPRLLCLGSLTPTKDQLTLVEALAMLDDLPWTAALVGSDRADPDYARTVRARVDALGLGARVSVPGARTGADLAATWHRSDLLVLTSRVETYGLVVAEALARGVPALVPAGTGAVEALRAGSLAPGTADRSVSEPAPGAAVPTPGAAVLPGDPATLAGVLRDWLTDPHQRAVWRAAARQRRARLPGWQQTASAVLAYLDRPRPGPPRTGSTSGPPPTPQPG